MSFDALSISCSYAGVGGWKNVSQPIEGLVIWGEDPDEGDVTVNSVPGKGDGGDPIVVITTAYDCRVYIGPDPEAADCPYITLLAGAVRTKGVRPNDRFRWVKL